MAFVDRQVVLPTIEFEEQETPLNKADLRAMWTAMRALDAFAFFNCGYESGARCEQVAYGTQYGELWTDACDEQPAAQAHAAHVVSVAQGVHRSGHGVYAAVCVGCCTSCGVFLQSNTTNLLQPPLLHFIDERLQSHPPTGVVQLPELPFLHFLHRVEIDAESESENAAGA